MAQPTIYRDCPRYRLWVTRSWSTLILRLGDWRVQWSLTKGRQGSGPLAVSVRIGSHG